MPQARREIAAALAALTLAAATGPAVAAKRARRHHGARQAARGEVVAVATPPRAQPPARPGASGPGHVTFVTEKRAYLDAGAQDGLQARQALALGRGGRAAGTCTIETLADHLATCVGARARVGDTFRVPGARASKKASASRELPTLVDEATLDERAASLAEAPTEKVDFHGTPGLNGRATATLAPGFATWRTLPDAGDAYTEERVDGILRAPLGSTGLRFDGAFSAQRWQSPASERFRPDQPSRFYLWEAEISRRQPDARTVLALGRIWPWHTPGVAALDGFQLGRRSKDQAAEVGAYAGFLPTAESLAPTTDTWTAGLYGSLAQAGVPKALLRGAREEARLAAWRSPATGLVGEAELLAQAWVGAASLGAGGRARMAPSLDGKPVVERATFDLGTRPASTFGGGLHVRYFGAAPPETAPLRDEVPALAGALHALGDVRVAPSPTLAVALLAGAHREGGTGRHQVHAAAELRLPRLFDAAGGLTLGGDVMDGWMRGLEGYLQAVARFRERVQLLFRSTLGVTEFQTPTAAPNLTELGGYLHVDGALGAHVRLRAWSWVRAPLLVQDAAPPAGALGFVAGGSLAGTF